MFVFFPIMKAPAAISDFYPSDTMHYVLIIFNSWSTEYLPFSIIFLLFVKYFTLGFNILYI